MKRITSIFILSVMIISLTACGAANENEIVNETPDVTENAAVSGSVTETEDLPEETEKAEEHTYGNTAGNIQNRGLVTGDTENVYYVSQKVKENAILYTHEIIKEDPDGSLKAIYSGGSPAYLNVWGEWLYYIDSNEGQIYKIRTDGTERTVISLPETVEAKQIMLADGYIYALAYGDDKENRIYKIDTATGDSSALLDLGREVRSFFVYNDFIYYSRRDDNGWGTFRVKLDGSENTGVSDFALYSACTDDNYIYYIDRDGRICKMTPDGASVSTVIDNTGILRINTSNGCIYYNDGEAIYKVKADGTESEKLFEFDSSASLNLNLLDNKIYLINQENQLQIFESGVK